MDKTLAKINSIVIPLPKSGNLEETGNYRDISLSLIAANMKNNMILNRIQHYLNPILY